MKTVEEMLEHILEAEGGFVNDPYDRGGATNWGITKQTLEAWRGEAITVEDVKELTQEEAKEIYKTNYYSKPKVNLLPNVLQPIVFDMCVNHGPRKAIKIFQRSLKQLDYPMSVDGYLGPQSANIAKQACDIMGWEKVNNKIVNERVNFYESIVAAKPKQGRFLKGWVNRANSFLAEA